MNDVLFGCLLGIGLSIDLLLIFIIWVEQTPAERYL